MLQDSGFRNDMLTVSRNRHSSQYKTATAELLFIEQEVVTHLFILWFILVIHTMALQRNLYFITSHNF